MNKNHQVQPENHKMEPYEDEIELIDILRVIWKWKYFILTGIIVCGLIPAVISLNMSKTYMIGMTLRPGILQIGEQGNKVYIDSPQNLKDLIESGTFNYDILRYLKDMKFGKIPRVLNFKVVIPEKSKFVNVYYETDNINQGVKIQNYLKELLIKEYAIFIEKVKKEYDIKLNLLKSEIDHLYINIESYRRNTKNIEKQIDELSLQTKFIKNNIAKLNKLISKAPREDNMLTTLINNNIIQQNLQLLNDNQNEIFRYKQEKEGELQNIEKSKNELVKKLNDIKRIQYQKDNIQNIQITRPPTKNPIPIKPKIKFNILLGLVAGLFLMIFLAFLFEYISKIKEKQS